jgi:purine-binding chemotaxis protein CheW
VNDRMPGKGQLVGLDLGDERPAPQACSLVVFDIGQQPYALPIDPVEQIVEMVTITPMPQENCLIEGVINVRGSMVPVVNLGSALGLPATKLELHTPIVLVHTQGRTVGLIVDQVRDVLHLPLQQMRRSADFLPDDLNGAPLIAGVFRSPYGVVLMLNLERLFTSESVGLPRILDYLQTLDESACTPIRGNTDVVEEAGT